MSQLLGKAFKRILITGSSSLVGKALIKDLSINNKIFCIDKKITKKINLPNVKYFKSDVMNEKKLMNIKRQIEKKKNWCNYKLFYKPKLSIFWKQKLKKFQNSINTNICGTFLITKIFYKLLKKSNNPQIINFDRYMD